MKNDHAKLFGKTTAPTKIVAILTKYSFLALGFVCIVRFLQR